ncbi:GNAT family N-acetyltransferase [Glaciihabitans sp. INWT7]|uniref:GNAT family N-acetyltransferase n=1 Tax=Glaciihabitans sp. INWT7 TaxID=2596912 RepID=UPI00162995CF|nr:GNAT family N-acetyltransferase [Glaciihabitans sp. INWT7]
MTEQIAAPMRVFTVVAESDGQIIGFAAAVPWRLPGSGAVDRAHMLLNYLAVDPARRRQGIGSALIAEIERRSLAARQNVIVAHVPAAQDDFYRTSGWEVCGDGRGYAWLPFNDHLRGDVADPELGFPLMAAKVLRPRAIRTTFDFPILSGAPIFDAVTELVRLIGEGRVDAGDLDGFTRDMVGQANQRSTSL